MPCGVEAIIAACNKAFGVETCECIQHSDGGCPVALPDALETAGNNTAQIGSATDGTQTTQEDISSGGRSEEENGASNPETEDPDGPGVEIAEGSASLVTQGDQLLASELGPDGRLLQEGGRAITTDMEIKFTTDVEVRIEKEAIYRRLEASENVS